MGRGDSYIRVTEVIVLYLLGVKVHGLVPLRVFESKMTTVRVIVIP